MLDTEAPGTTAASEPVSENPPPRRRRTASRPAGPPPAVEPAPTTPAVEADVSADQPSAAEPEAAAPPKRRRAARATKTAETAPATEPEAVPDTDKSAEPAPAKPARKRTRKTAEPVAEQVGEPPVEAPPAEQAAESVALAEVAEAAPAEDKPKRRRRAKQPEPSDVEQATDPSVEASLEALTEEAPRRRSRRRAKSVEPAFEMDGDTSAADVLESLAAAIAAGDSAPVAEGDASQREPEAQAPDAEAEGVATEDAPEAVASADVAEGPAQVGDAESAEEAESADESQEGEQPTADEPAESADEAQELSDSGEDDDSEDGDEAGAPRRRRRRRGGRRRRRGGSDDRTDEEGAGAEDETEDSTEDDNGEEASSEGSGRRRRRRRRRGEDTSGAEDDPSDVVVRVREPRRQKSAADEVTGIDGSTRMEAKRQRRREGRAAGRRRAPILSEAEFLARRESVDRQMVIRQAEDYTQLAVLEDGVLVEHYVDRASATSLIGNVYLGRVQNVLPSMEAAFVDIGRGRNAVLYAGEVDWEGFGVTGGDRKIEKVFKSGQSVLVQVSKDPVGAKGARLTSHISIPGRYVVYSPNGQLSGISRKLPEQERKRLKDVLEGLVGEHASVIVRTAAEGASEDELIHDVNRLKAQWEIIEKKVKSGQAPQSLYSEPDLTVRIVRDLFTEDFTRLVVDGNGQGEDAYDTVEAYVSHVAPHLAERLVHWNRAEQGDLFDHHRINEQVAKALERKVFLPSGGSLIIDRTEAMTVIDVNTGKFTGSSGNLEATVTSNNLEAAEEIVRQLRLRDIGGIIVIDFIDMVLPSNRELLLRRLVECLSRDRTRHQVAEVTSLGLVQMTRKKIGTGLAEAFTVACETCKGRGYHVHDAPVPFQAPADGGDRDNGKRGGQRGGRSRQSGRKKDQPVAEQPGPAQQPSNGAAEPGSGSAEQAEES